MLLNLSTKLRNINHKSQHCRHIKAILTTICIKRKKLLPLSAPYTLYPSHQRCSIRANRRPTLPRPLLVHHESAPLSPTETAMSRLYVQEIAPRLPLSAWCRVPMPYRTLRALCLCGSMPRVPEKDLRSAHCRVQGRSLSTASGEKHMPLPTPRLPIRQSHRSLLRQATVSAPQVICKFLFSFPCIYSAAWLMPHRAYA